MAADPTRRVVLASCAAALPVLLAACKGVQALGAPPPEPASVRVLKDAIVAEEQMVARYRGALADARTATDSSVLAALGGVLAEHEQHLAELQARLSGPAAGRPAAPGARGGPAPAGVPAGLAAALGVLEAAEQASCDRLTGELTSVPPSLAQLFASVAASEATHVEFLRSVGRTP